MAPEAPLLSAKSLSCDVALRKKENLARAGRQTDGHPKLRSAGSMSRNVAQRNVTNQPIEPTLTTSALCAQHLRRTSLTSAAVSVADGGTGWGDWVTKK